MDGLDQPSTAGAAAALPGDGGTMTSGPGVSHKVSNVGVLL